MELWDIYDRDKQRTGRTMKRNDWHMQPGDFHLTVLGVIRHTNGKYLITKRVMTKAWAPGSWDSQAELVPTCASARPPSVLLLTKTTFFFVSPV